MTCRSRRLTTLALAFATLLAVPGARAAAEHRVVDEHALRQNATAVTHAPNWYQFRIDNYHPIGCGPLAWTMLYAYWHSFKGADHLFPVTPTDMTSPGASSAEVAEVAGEVAASTETSHGQFGSNVFGRTWTSDLCKGIEYAQGRGYPGSRCLKITGSEFDKFERIKEYIRSDRPVILNINHEGQGILDHYVIVEGTRKRQEKVAGSWRDRDVEYLANFGWSERGGSRWISVRQVGANTGTVYTSGAAYLVDVSDTPLPEAASANEAACKDWCEANQPECKLCSHLAGCGPGYRALKSWTEAGRNWYACAQKDSRRSEASEDHRQACESWCEEHRADRGCLKCDTRLGCGAGYVQLESWTGYGNNWYACRKEGPSGRERASDQNHTDCLAWCDARTPGCVECSQKLNCGIGLERLESWTGYGNNWYACGKSDYGRASEGNRTACETWCRSNQPLCVECAASVGCGAGQTSMKAFQGEGKNWYACRKASSQANKEACQAWCDAHKPACRFCSEKDYCGRGYDRMELFKGPGENWAACRAR